MISIVTQNNSKPNQSHPINLTYDITTNQSIKKPHPPICHGLG